MITFWDRVGIAKISTALILIVILLMYIAYKLSEDKPKKRASR